MNNINLTKKSDYSLELQKVRLNVETCLENLAILRILKNLRNYDKNKESCEKKDQYYVCAIIKDEHEYIREWVLYNKSIGFNKIVLYDN